MSGSGTTTTTVATGAGAAAGRPRLGQLKPSHLHSTAQWQWHARSAEKADHTEGSKYSPTAVAATSLAMGLVFGFAMEKGQVYWPHVIRNQFRFTDLTMLKMFLAAMATSAMVIELMKKRKSERHTHEYTVNFTRGVAAVVTGGFVLGLGMELSGSCPGTVWIQAGAGAGGFTMVLLGGLTGGLVFSYVFEHLERSGFLSSGKEFLERHPSLPDTGYSGFALAAVLAGVIYAAEVFVPYSGAGGGGGSVLSATSWHPAVAGIFVGLLQVPGALVMGELIGSSQSYVTVAANLTRRLGLPQTDYLKKYSSGLLNYQQVIYGAGAICGALLSWSMSHNFDVAQLLSTTALPSASSAALSYVGGVCLVFGARLASGCTSGLGISGAGSLATGSFIGVAGMFGGAIGLAVLRHLVGL